MQSDRGASLSTQNSALSTQNFLPKWVQESILAAGGDFFGQSRANDLIMFECARGGNPGRSLVNHFPVAGPDRLKERGSDQDRKSTRLNSSHANTSYAVFCLKK